MAVFGQCAAWMTRIVVFAHPSSGPGAETSSPVFIVEKATEKLEPMINGPEGDDVLSKEDF